MTTVLRGSDQLPLPPPDHLVTATSNRESTYAVHVTPGERAALERLAAEIGGRAVSVITDHTVDRLHTQRLVGWLSDRGIAVDVVAIPAGERSKSLFTAFELIDWLSKVGFGRRDVLLAVGGGVVIDTVGWVASAYMRGVPYINVPTTLLAQVDAGIGGKVGVDHGTAKNLVGAFYEPQAVVSCVAYLGTLDVRQVRAGLAEVIKKATIASPELFEFIEGNVWRLLALDQPLLRTLVHAASAIKCTLVQRDPYEQDLRRILNFGHTVGHAIETATGYGPVLHGEAVAFGMAVAVRISAARDLASPETAQRIIGVLRSAGLPVRYEDLPAVPLAEEVIAALEKIRQVRAGSLRFVLPTGIGSTAIVDDVTDEEIFAALDSSALAGTRVS